MKIKLLKIFIFISFIIFCDRLLGLISQKLYEKSNDYEISNLRYTLDSTKEDILILGGSRAENHFVPGIINKNTRLTCYNCGRAAQGLLFSLIQLNESLKRYKPKLIVVDVSPNVLLDPESLHKLKILKPFYKKDPLIYDALTQDGIFEKVKFLSSIYPYNSTIYADLRGYFKQDEDSLNGFVPLSGVIDTNGLATQISKDFSSPMIPSEKFTYLKRIIMLCNNNSIKIAVVVSPVYQTSKNLDEMTNQIKTICLQYKNIFFLDYSKHKHTYGQNKLFYNHLHLNSYGAKIFSEAISNDLKEIIAH